MNSFKYFSVAGDVKNYLQSLVDIYHITCYIHCPKISRYNQIQTVGSTVDIEQPRIKSPQFSSLRNSLAVFVTA